MISSVRRRDPSTRALSRILGALAAAAVTGAAGGALALDLNTLYFERQSSPGTVLDTRVTGAGQSVAWGASELKTTLVSAPLDDVHLDLESTTNTCEVHAFAVDPSEHAALMRTLTAVEMANDPNGGTWSSHNQTPTYSVDVSLPYDVVVPYPNEDILTAGDSALLDYTRDRFTGSTPHQFNKIVTEEGGPHIRAVQVMDHGDCSYEVPFRPIFDQIQDTLWGRFAAGAQHSDASAIRFYSHMVPYLEHTPGDPVDLRGGFFLDLHYEADLLDVVPYPSFAFADYQLSVDSHGAVVVTKDPSVSFVQPPPPLWNQALSDGLDEIASDFNDTLDTQQRQVVLPAWLDKCDPEEHDPCKAAADMFAEAIQDGAKVVTDAGIVDLGDDEDVASLVESVERRNEDDVLTRWRCDKREVDGEAERLCTFKIPVKRLNVYPDAFELVWFDGPELDNAAYAAWIASYSPLVDDGKAAREELCAYSANTHPYYQREYAADERGPDAYHWEPGACFRSCHEDADCSEYGAETCDADSQCCI